MCLEFMWACVLGLGIKVSDCVPIARAGLHREQATTARE